MKLIILAMGLLVLPSCTSDHLPAGWPPGLLGLYSSRGGYVPPPSAWDPWIGGRALGLMTEYQSIPSPPEGITAIYAPEIVRAYKNNEVAADNWLKDKRFAVMGVVDRIGKDLLGSPYVTLCGDGFLTVQCMFDTGDTKEIDAIAELQPGRRVIIIGVGAGKFFNVLMRQCKVHAVSEIVHR